MYLTPGNTLGLVLAGAVTGLLGAILGTGGGVFLVPVLVIAMGLPMRYAVATSIAPVIATSSAVASTNVERGTANIRLGMTLEIATVLGAIAGGLTAGLLARAGRALRRGPAADGRADVARPDQGRLGGRGAKAQVRGRPAPTDRLGRWGRGSSTSRRGTWSPIGFVASGEGWRSPSSRETSRACSALAAGCSRCLHEPGLRRADQGGGGDFETS